MPDSSGKIPIVVGVTGHRFLPAKSLPALRDSVRKELSALMDSCPNSPFVLLTNLAEGADLLAAETALELGFTLKAALPMPEEAYAAVFSEEGLRSFRELIARAESVFPAPETERALDGKDYLYRQADIYVAEHCHVLLALWDGSPAVQGGCGTAETVSFCLTHDYTPANRRAIMPNDGTVIHIRAPRSGNFEEAGSVRVLGNEEAFRRILRDTDRFNASVKTASSPSYDLIPGEKDAVTAKIERAYHAADSLSLKNARSYRLVLKLMAAAATLIALSFLLYDEAALYVLVLVPGAMIAALFLTDRIASKLHCHRNYLEYRALAETLRVQAYLRHSGSNEALSGHLPWPMELSAPWVRKAVGALTIGPVPGTSHSVLDLWVRSQKEYHLSALENARDQERGSSLITKVALVITVAAYFGALLFELIPGGLLTGKPLFEASVLDFYRTFLKILLGSLSAITLFVSSYYGKLSLPNAIADHERMASLCRSAEELFRTSPESEDALLALAKEELSENASWFSYKSANRPDISL